MIMREPTLHEIKIRGLRALAKALGPAGLIRFLRQYQTGSGDYTKDRAHWLGSHTMDHIAGRIRQKRKHK